MAAMLDFLPESKRASVKKAMADSQSRVGEFADELRIDPAGTFLKMQRETEAAFQAVLTPEEFHDYQLCFSQTAQNLRHKLSVFDPVIRTDRRRQTFLIFLGCHRARSHLAFAALFPERRSRSPVVPAD